MKVSQLNLSNYAPQIKRSEQIKSILYRSPKAYLQKTIFVAQ